MIFLTTRSVFYIRNSRFISNKAEADSAICSIKANLDEEFIIDNCIFMDNKAVTNTVSIKESNGLIKSCLFRDNEAEKFSKNIFAIFSKLNVTSTTFENTKLKN